MLSLATISLESSQPFLSLSLLPPPHFFQKESRPEREDGELCDDSPGELRARL